MNWRDVGFLAIGLFVGANVGLFVLALCVAARRGDEMGRGWGTGDVEKRGKDGGPETEDGERKVIFERKTVVSKRTCSPRKPDKKPSGPPPPPPLGPKKLFNRKKIRGV